VKDYDTAVKSFEERYQAHQAEVKRVGKTAKERGLSYTQYVLLTALADGRPASYRDIIGRTGIYSKLPAELRERHHSSLGVKGLILEAIFLIGDDKVFAFQITGKGWKLLGRPVESGPVKDFEQRHRDWEARLERATQLGARVGLSAYQFLILEALGDGEQVTFNNIASRTSISSGLPKLLRERHEGSLSSRGYVREWVHEIGNHEVYAFSITEVGKRTLARAAE
jgi:DNA-binding MarR family transcriptional regulator